MGGDTSAVKKNTIEIQWQKERMENIKYGRRREGQWTPIRAKAQDNRANPNSWETHLVRKRWDIGRLRALSPRFMMMMMIRLFIHSFIYAISIVHLQVRYYYSEALPAQHVPEFHAEVPQATVV